MTFKFKKENTFKYSLTIIAGILSTIGYSHSVFSQTVTTINTTVSNPSGDSPWTFGSMDILDNGSLNIDGGSATSTGWIRLTLTPSQINVINNGYFNANYISLGYGTGNTQLNINSGSIANIDKISASDFGGDSFINIKDKGSVLNIRELNMASGQSEGPGTLTITQSGGTIANSINLNNGKIYIDGAGSYLNVNSSIYSNSSYREIIVDITNGGTLKTKTAEFRRFNSSSTSTISIDGNGSSFTADDLILSGTEGSVSLIISNQGNLNLNTLSIDRFNTINEDAVVNLESAGTIEANQIAGNSSSSSNNKNLLYIDEGTIRAKTSNTNFFKDIASISLGANGLTLDTQSNSIGINSIFFDKASSTPGTFRKIGSGTLTLSGSSSYSGGTNIENGLLIAANDNAVGTGDVTIGGAGNNAQMQVNSGVVLPNTIEVAEKGNLYGTGEVGETTVKSGGQIQAGLTTNDIGILKISGNLTLDSGSTYYAQLATDGSYASDLLSVYGDVVLDGGKLYYSEIGDNYEEGKYYTVIEALGSTGTGTGTITGTLNVSGDTPFLNFDGKIDTSSSGGNNNIYVIGATRNNVKFSEYALTPNQKSTANALDQSNINGKLDNYVAGLSESYVRTAFDLLSGEIHSTLRNSLLSWSQDASQISLDQLRYNMMTASNICPTNNQGTENKPTPTLSSCNSNRPLAGWAQVVGNWNQTSSDGNAAKSKTNTGGLVIGTDYSFDSSGWRIGGMFGYGKSTVKSNSRRSNADLENYTLGVYAGKHFDWGTSEHVNVMGGLSYTHHTIKTDRLIPRINQTLEAKYSGNTVQAFGEVGYTLAPVGTWNLEPFLGLNVSKQKVGSFDETGGYAGVNSKAESKTYTTAMLGVHAQSEMDVSGKPLQVRGTVGLKQALGNKEVTRTMAFNQGSPDYLIWGVPRSSSTLVLGIQAQMALTPAATLEAGFNGEFGKKVREQSIQARVRWAF